MRRFFLIIAAIFLLVCMPVTANAAVASPRTQVFATVSPDGSCQITLSVTLQLTEQGGDLTYPIPGASTDVTLNGSRASSSRSDGVRYVKLNKLLSHALGEITFTIHYSLDEVVYTTENSTLELRLPILTGFEAPVENLDFSVTLPGNIDTLPGFESGYHQRSIEQDLTYQVEGAMITGKSLNLMKDHETLMLLLDVNETMFPKSLVKARDYSWGIRAMKICTLVALAYWLLFLRNFSRRRQWCTEPPEGRTAGELGSILYLQGTDLTMTVLSWATLGYVLLQPTKGGRVRIHKRMDMGSERKSAEQRLFNALFAKSETLDTGSARYAHFCREAAKRPMAIQELLQKRSGNPLVFRVLATGIGLFGGLALAVSLSGGALLMGLLILLLGALGALSGWYIQLWARYLMLRRWGQLSGCLAVCLLWFLLSWAGGAVSVALWMVLGLLVAGGLFSVAGRRTDQGKLETARVLGLRQYLRSASREELQQLSQEDPGYFFHLAPCAMALGLDGLYAKRFAGIKLEECPYLLLDGKNRTTAKDWMRLLKSVADAMDARARQLPWQKLLHRRKR